MISESPQTHGLSGDLGWNEADETDMNGLNSSLLLVATSIYFGSVWLLSGLPPLPFFISRHWLKHQKQKSDGRRHPA